MKARLILFAVLTIALLSGSGSAIAAGAIYYVAPNGNDANPGTIASPWLHVQKAANVLQAGDTVLIRGGVYNEQVKPQNSGNATAGYITYAAYPNETVTIDGGGKTLGTWDGLFWINGKSYIRVSGLRVVNAKGGYDTTGIRVDRSSYITVEQNYTYNTQSSGIGVWSSSFVTVDGNEIENANVTGSEENLSVDSSHDVEVKNNNIHHAYNSSSGGEGLDIKNGSYNVKVHHNWVHDQPKLAFALDGWTSSNNHDIYFYDNIAERSAYGYVIEAEAGGTLNNIFVYNNIAANNRGAGLFMPGTWGSNPNGGLKSNIYFINNTSYHNGTGLSVQNTNVRNVVARNNILYANSTAVSVTSAASGQVFQDHNLTANPLFANPAGGDFHLLAGSPAIDAGNPANAPSDDYDGKARPQGAGFDVGAYEAAGVAGVTPTATAQPTDTPTSTATPTATSTPVSPTATPVSPTVTATPTSTPSPTPVIYICTTTMQDITGGYQITTTCLRDDSKG